MFAAIVIKMHVAVCAISAAESAIFFGMTHNGCVIRIISLYAM